MFISQFCILFVEKTNLKATATQWCIQKHFVVSLFIPHCFTRHVFSPCLNVTTLNQSQYMIELIHMDVCHFVISVAIYQMVAQSNVVL